MDRTGTLRLYGVPLRNPTVRNGVLNVMGKMHISGTLSISRDCPTRTVVGTTMLMNKYGVLK